jgi:hypothetical protein
MALLDPSLRGAAAGCAALALLVLGAGVCVAAREMVVCDTKLEHVPTPADWKDQPVLSGLGGFEVKGGRAPCVGHGLQCGVEDAHLAREGVCPSESFSLRSWFDEQGIYGNPSQVHLRRLGSTYVVTAMDYPGSQERLLGAFREVGGLRHPAFLGSTGEASALLLALALGLIAVALVGAEHETKRLAEYADRSRYLPGALNGANAVVLDEGGPPLPIVATRRRGSLSGRVLVRLSHVTEGGYREAPSARVVEVVEGDLASLTHASIARSSRRLRMALRGGILCFALVFLAQACTAIGNVSLD